VRREDHDLDRILSRGEEIVPSSGFLDSVMDAVRAEASAPPPIPFPWKRALPGLIAAVVMLGVVLVVGAGHFDMAPPAVTGTLSRRLESALESPSGMAAGGTLAGLLLSLAAVKFSVRAVSGKP
jgi:hypothetical protein